MATGIPGGLKAFLVGGCVRDRLLGVPVRDRDWVVVGGTPEDMTARGFQRVGKGFPVFLHPETAEEYALARTGWGERVTRSGDRITLIGYVGTGDWCDQWLGRREVHRELSGSEWLTLIDAIITADFWALPEVDGRIGLDGETWGFEGRQGSLRHRISRWSPEDDTIIRLGQFFIDLARG